MMTSRKSTRDLHYDNDEQNNDEENDLQAQMNEVVERVVNRVDGYNFDAHRSDNKVNSEDRKEHVDDAQWEGKKSDNDPLSISTDSDRDESEEEKRFRLFMKNIEPEPFQRASISKQSLSKDLDLDQDPNTNLSLGSSTIVRNDENQEKQKLETNKPIVGEGFIELPKPINSVLKTKHRTSPLDQNASPPQHCGFIGEDSIASSSHQLYQSRKQQQQEMSHRVPPYQGMEQVHALQATKQHKSLEFDKTRITFQQQQNRHRQEWMFRHQQEKIRKQELETRPQTERKRKIENQKKLQMKKEGDCRRLKITKSLSWENEYLQKKKERKEMLAMIQRLHAEIDSLNMNITIINNNEDNCHRNEIHKRATRTKAEKSSTTHLKNVLSNQKSSRQYEKNNHEHSTKPMHSKNSSPSRKETNAEDARRAADIVARMQPSMEDFNSYSSMYALSMRLPPANLCDMQPITSSAGLDTAGVRRPYPNFTQARGGAVLNRNSFVGDSAWRAQTFDQNGSFGICNTVTKLEDKVGTRSKPRKSVEPSKTATSESMVSKTKKRKRTSDNNKNMKNEQRKKTNTTGLVTKSTTDNINKSEIFNIPNLSKATIALRTKILSNLERRITNPIRIKPAALKYNNNTSTTLQHGNIVQQTSQALRSAQKCGAAKNSNIDQSNSSSKEVKSSIIAVTRGSVAPKAPNNDAIKREDESTFQASSTISQGSEAKETILQPYKDELRSISVSYRKVGKISDDRKTGDLDMVRQDKDYRPTNTTELFEYPEKDNQDQERTEKNEWNKSSKTSAKKCSKERYRERQPTKKKEQVKVLIKKTIKTKAKSSTKDTKKILKTQEKKSSKPVRKIGNKYDTAWMIHYNDLNVYQSEHNGATKVPRHYEKDPALGLWVKRQRDKRRQGKYCKKRIQMLDDIGFTWNIRTKWDNMFERLRLYNKTFGSTRVTREKELELFDDINRVGSKNQSKDPAAASSFLLSNVATSVTSTDLTTPADAMAAPVTPSASTTTLADGEQHAKDKQLFLAFYDKSTGSDGPLEDCDEDDDNNANGTPLRLWVFRQRACHRAKMLSKERIDKLNTIGFIWDAMK